jgi:hypothetical protein
MNYTTTTTLDNYWKNRQKDFVKTLKEIIENYIILEFGNDLKLDVEMGLFTSDNYGSYRINFYNKEKEIVAYTIADTIMGEWKTYKTNKYE